MIRESIIVVFLVLAIVLAGCTQPDAALDEPDPPASVSQPDGSSVHEGELEPAVYEYGRNMYSMSPDGQWGYYVDRYYTRDKHNMSRRVLLKDFQTGEITELFDVWRSPRLLWLKDNTLLIQKFSYVYLKNQILIYNPIDAEFENVIYASLYSVTKDHQRISYALNEWTRTEKILDLKTGKKRLYNSERDYDAFYGQNALWGDKTLSEGSEYEHSLVFDDRKIDITFAYQSNGHTFIPVRPLMADYGIEVTRACNSEYIPTFRLTGLTEHVLELEEMDIIRDRLFVREDILAEIGVPSFEVIKYVE